MLSIEPIVAKTVDSSWLSKSHTIKIGSSKISQRQVQDAFTFDFETRSYIDV